MAFEPDHRWIPFWKLAFGFLLLTMLGLLALAIGLGKVHKEDSYGLEYILGSISSLSGGFVIWAFTAAVDAEKASKMEESIQKIIEAHMTKYLEDKKEPIPPEE